MSVFKKIIDRSKSAKSNQEIENLIEELTTLIEEKKHNSELLHARAALYTKQELYGKAINDYRTILAIDSTDKHAAGKFDILSTILRFSGNDIYANPNTNLDPWLE